MDGCVPGETHTCAPGSRGRDGSEQLREKTDKTQPKDFANLNE